MLESGISAGMMISSARAASSTSSQDLLAFTRAIADQCRRRAEADQIVPAGSDPQSLTVPHITICCICSKSAAKFPHWQ